MNSDLAVRKQRLKKALETVAFVPATERAIVSRGRQMPKEDGWLFDIRRIILRADVLEDVNTLFWDTFRDRYPFQIGGLETAAIPLVTSLVLHGAVREGHADASGFFLRKSRKKDGLMNMVEGTLVPERPIILVDDLMNSGRSFIRQVEVLESLGYTVTAIWVLVRFRDRAYYEYFKEKNIAIHALFELNDFAETLQTENLTKNNPPPPPAQHYKTLWKFASANPSYQHVVSKSDPVLDESHLYVGSDAGIMYALRQETGETVWSYRIAWHPKGKGIFSSPAVYDGIVYFGGYDGNIYALDAQTGKRKWVSFEADWVGSSPSLAPDLGRLFIGLEYGLMRKRGGVAALDLKTGKTIWAYRDMPCLTHSSPHYIRRHRQVAIGSNDGAAYLFNAKTGALVWKYETGVPSEEEMDSGFSAHDIKESFAYDERHDRIIFGNTNGLLSFVDRGSGESAGIFTAEAGFFSTPVIYKNMVLASSLDKHLYAVDLDTFEEKWRWSGRARIFATPVIIDGSIYIGTNTGRMTEIDPENGKELSSLTLTERITNKVAYNAKTKRFFVPTFANEIFCVEKKKVV